MINVVLSPRALIRHVVHFPAGFPAQMADFALGPNVFDVTNPVEGTFFIDVLDDTSVNIVKACAAANNVSHIIIDDDMSINDVGVEPDTMKEDTRMGKPMAKLNLSLSNGLKDPKECGCKLMK